MHMMGMARVGNDMVVRTLPNGQAVGQVSLAFSYGRKQPPDNQQQTQWIEGAMFGDRAANLAPYIKKGMTIFVHMDDVHVESYTGKGGDTMYSMKARIQSIEFGGRDHGTGTNPVPGKPAPTTPRQGELEDDIPF